MQLLKRSTTLIAMMLVAVAASLAFVDDADARRGGSFGSRGARTYSAPAATPTAPRTATPIERSMTQPSAAAPAATAAAQAARPGLFGGFGGSMLRGLAIGGLIGMLLGHGFGGLAGGFGFILQIALLAFGAMFLMRFLANRNQPSPAGAASAGPVNNGPATSFRDAMSGFGFGGGSASAVKPSVPANARNAKDEVGISDGDLETFEKLLDEIQGAFGREDYAALRQRTTPEIMSYLSEELSQNATAGVRNEVTNVKLLQGDLAEAWREDDTDYATVAMRYESRDWMRDRNSNRVVSGDSERTSETTEIWTFSRVSGGDWKLSAIQEL